MPPLAIAAAIVGGATVAGATLNASAAGHAADLAQRNATETDALQRETYATDQSLLNPSIDRGNAAADELQGFLGLGGDPLKAKAALDTYLNSTGYQFARQQGLDAVRQSLQSEGLYDSGAALKALDQYATGEAQQYGQQYAQDLGGVADRGQGGLNALVASGQHTTDAEAAANTTAAAASGRAAMADATSTNALIGAALNAFGLTRGQSSFGAANAFAPGG